MQIGEELQRGTNVIKFDGLINNAIVAFEKNKITEVIFYPMLEKNQRIFVSP